MPSIAKHQADFWLLRECFLPPIEELDQVATLLSEAVDAFMLGDPVRAAALVQRADMPIVHRFAARLMGPVDQQVTRFRTFDYKAPTKDVVRMPNRGFQLQIFERDGYRCRFCGCRVVLSEARRALAPMVRWGNTSDEMHAAFFAIAAVADHLVPHSRGGSNDAENFVTTCQGCNYCRGNWLIEEVGLVDPRTRPPKVDEWDGLSRIFGAARKLKSSRMTGLPGDRGAVFVQAIG